MLTRLRRLARRALRRRPPERIEECICGTAMPVSKAHLIVDTYDEPEFGGGSAVSAAYCRAHCPGGCNHPKEHR